MDNTAWAQLCKGIETMCMCELGQSMLDYVSLNKVTSARVRPFFEYTHVSAERHKLAQQKRCVRVDIYKRRLSG